MPFGTTGKHLGSYSTDQSSNEFNDGVPTSKVFIQTIAGTTTYTFAPNRSVRIVAVRGVMSGAGAASDTIVVKDASNNAITNTIDVSALADQDTFTAAKINDAYSSIGNWNGGFKVVTASDALAFVEIELLNLAGSGQSGF